MDQYKNYTTDDFIWDNAFRQWVLAPTRETDMRWKTWLTQNPEMQTVVDKAKTIVRALRINEPTISDTEIAYIVRNTMDRAEGNNEVDFDLNRKDISFYRRYWLHMAASVLILILSGWFITTRYFRFDKATTDQPIAVATDDGYFEKINLSGKSEVLHLQDGSRIVLASQSRVRYRKNFVQSKREVYLTGAAFFDIAKDPTRPFFVYANDLITKVLGTSFTVKAYETSKQVTVEVKTGRVSVFTKADPDADAKTNNRELEGIVLSPNQKIIFTKNYARMVKTLVEKPEIVVPKSRVPEFVFEDIPVTQVFDSIGKAYGIDILYDEELLKGCPLTATLDNQTLHDKLTIICKAIEANYEILDGQIVIHGQGCKN